LQYNNSQGFSPPKPKIAPFIEKSRWKLAEIGIVTIDTTDNSFEEVFAKYKDDVLRILSNAFPTYYGDDYQLKRILEGQSMLFLAIVDGICVGVSYIKRNHRRGGTAVFPKQYRRMGIAEKLVRESLQLFPRQYTILSVDNHRMLSLIEKIGFKKAQSLQEIQDVAPNEFPELTDFEFSDGYFTFNRRSVRRGSVRERLTFLHTYESTT